MTHDLNLKLRPAAPHDFKKTRSDGSEVYLFGKIYAVKDSERWSFNIFRSSEISKLHFTECYKAGMVYVIDNADDAGVIDASHD